MSIGSRITDLRTSKGLTRVQLADILEIPMTTLRNYETDSREPGHKFLVKIANYFGVTTDYILENEKSPTPEGAEEEERIIDEFESDLRRVLNKHSLLIGDDLCEADSDFLSHIISIIDAYFKKGI